MLNIQLSENIAKYSFPFPTMYHARQFSSHFNQNTMTQKTEAEANRKIQLCSLMLGIKMTKYQETGFFFVVLEKMLFESKIFLLTCLHIF